MALVEMIDVSKQYDTKRLFANASFSLDSGERVVIVGQNGTGKSTLMKFILQVAQPDEGRVIIQNNLDIQMLAQQPKFEANLTVKEAIENELTELKNAKDEYDEINIKLAEDYDNKELIARSSQIATFLDFHNAWDLDNKVDRVIKEFALKEYENKPVNLLSGGEQRRVALASLLLKKPDILLLDEPTNHLDVYMVEFLEEMLLKEKFTILFISHDRYFIDNIATRTVEIDNCELRNFAGGYTSYLAQKERLLQNMQKEHMELLRTLKVEEEWLARGVQGRRKRNEGRKERLMDLRKEAKSNPSLIRKMSLELQREKSNFANKDKQSKKKMLFEIEHLDKKLGTKKLIEDFSARILQRDKIAIVGKNGAGKSTLLKILLEKEPIDSGVIKRGDIKIGYFDQHREFIDDSKTITETFCPNGGDRVEVYGKNMHVYGYLKNFLFPKEYLDKKIGVLSGGEKNRVALALLFTKKVDCLILDEPTNDLDIPTINILEEHLQKFEGALIFVSHDRYFVDKISQKLFVFKGDGVVEESYQQYSEYLDIEKAINELTDYETELNKAPKQVAQKPKQQKKKLSYNEQREYDNLPARIEELELEIAKLNECLSDPECYQEIGISKVANELKEVEEEYEKSVDRYLELEEMIEQMQSE
jgi:ATP-binding cassette subfamily F protein uup